MFFNIGNDVDRKIDETCRHKTTQRPTESLREGYTNCEPVSLQALKITEEHTTGAFGSKRNDSIPMIHDNKQTVIAFYQTAVRTFARPTSPRPILCWTNRVHLLRLCHIRGVAWYRLGTLHADITISNTHTHTTTTRQMWCVDETRSGNGTDASNPISF